MRTIQFGLALLLFGVAAPLYADRLTDPGPVQVPAGLAEIDVPRSIAHAFVVLGWKQLERTSGRITASYDAGDGIARVLIVYDGKTVRLSYLDSNGLDYEEQAGGREISYRYNDWVKSLATEIARFDPGGRRTAPPNSPPSEKFSDFGEFELKPVTIAELYAKGVNNVRAANRVQRDLYQHLGTQIQLWKKAAPAGQQRKLLIEPHIESIRFVAGGIRFITHDWAGDSSISLQVTYTDADTGAVLASPRFFLEPNVEGRPGDSDNKMLSDIAELVYNYTVNNYKEPVGGPAGDLPPPP